MTSKISSKRTRIDDRCPGTLGLNIHSVEKPDITIEDLEDDLSYASSTRKMFTLIGIKYIQENNPFRFSKLLIAAQNIHDEPYMTADLYDILYLCIECGIMSPREEWMRLFNSSHAGLIIKVNR